MCRHCTAGHGVIVFSVLPTPSEVHVVCRQPLQTCGVIMHRHRPTSPKKRPTSRLHSFTPSQRGLSPMVRISARNEASRWLSVRSRTPRSLMEKNSCSNSSNLRVLLTQTKKQRKKKETGYTSCVPSASERQTERDGDAATALSR